MKNIIKKLTYDTGFRTDTQTLLNKLSKDEVYYISFFPKLLIHNRYVIKKHYLYLLLMKKMLILITN